MHTSRTEQVTVRRAVGPTVEMSFNVLWPFRSRSRGTVRAALPSTHRPSQLCHAPFDSRIRCNAMDCVLATLRGTEQRPQHTELLPCQPVHDGRPSQVWSNSALLGPKLNPTLTASVPSDIAASLLGHISTLAPAGGLWSSSSIVPCATAFHSTQHKHY